ncbi:hypothetical protein BG006_001858 [Podila minutissima]|uniref:F-box domain-containing protein n=1 Tax=Podila minutissima TaxID=64525 RepID=A0A9P5S9W1_9FUNG|nr:hypothetical protein BG006_001858 [Podila minutissima]
MSTTPTSSQLPIELIIQIAKHIDGPTVAVFLQVCRQWRDFFSHLRLRDISKSHWHQPKFPLRDTVQLRETKLAPVLCHVQSLEWFTNTALTAPPSSSGIEYTCRRQRQYPGERQLLGLMSTTLSSLTFGHREIDRRTPFKLRFTYGRARWNRKNRPQAILPAPDTPCDANIPPNINNNTTATTATAHPRLNVRRPATSNVLQIVLPCIASLERLTYLRLDLHQNRVPTFIPPLHWLLLLSRLEELQLEGTAALFRLPARKALIQSAPRRMRVLKIQMLDIVFVECSPRLKELRLHHVSYRDYHLPATITPSTTPLGLWCPDLEALTLTGFSSRSQAPEQTAMISSLKRLKSLVAGVSDVRALGDPAGAQSLFCGPEMAVTLSNLLRTRPKLKRLLVPLARCDPRELFALHPALARESESWEPACADELAELSIGLNLKVLSIRSVDIDRQAAVEEIACAGGRMNMERLTMMDSRAAAWQDYELAQWLELLLELMYRYLKLLKPDNLAEIREWMVELGFWHVELGWENWRMIKY